MNSITHPARTPRSVRALVASAISLLLVVAGVLSAPSAIAATSTVTGGELSWGIDAQYLSVFTNRASESPAIWTADDTVARFPADAAGSSYSEAAGTGTLTYSGAVRVGYFAGPPMPGVAEGNYFYLKNPTIIVNGVTGSLIASQVAGSSHSLAPELPTHSGSNVTIATLDLSAAPTSAASSVSWTSVPVTITAEGAGYLAKYATAEDATPTVRAAGSALAPLSFSIILEAPTPVTPAVEVSKTADLDPAGESVTVTGGGFFPNAPATDGTRTPLKDKFGGAYVQFGYYDGSTWKGGSSSNASLTKWALGPDDVGIAGALGVPIIDGTFSAALTPMPVETAPDDARYGIRTYGGSGSTYAPFATFTEITFADELPEPAIEVFLADGVTPVGNTVVDDGDTLLVKGAGFDPAANIGGSGVPIPSSLPQGTFVVFGSFGDDWRPSDGASSASRVMHKDARIWALAENVLDQVPAPFQSTIREAWVPIEEDGSFVAEVTAVSSAEPLAEGNWGIYTYAAGVGTPPNASQELTVGINFVTEDAGEEPIDPVVPPAPTTDGVLRWAISSSFSDYITGPIANGSITVTGGATRAGGQFQFGQASGSTFNPQTGFGTTAYSGSVRFAGHGGALDVTVSNPHVRITSASAATLHVSHGGAQVAFAALNLAAAAKTVTNGAVTYTSAPASLTSAGQTQVFQGNATALDPVTFTIGKPAAAPAGSTGTVASAALASDDDIPTSPPATTGIELSDDERATLESGGIGSVSAFGFTPNEKGIAIVVYSAPILLATVTADAKGVAKWTGSLPTSLADGNHTLTMQGSVDRGVVLNLRRAGTPLAAGMCVAEGATLRWGFKPTFLTYLEGIAHGGWDVTDVEYAYPEFVWSSGGGAVDAGAATGLITFGGAIAFHGHDGALNTTLNNARLEFAGDTGYVVFDIAGTTQAGETVDERGVRLAEFTLADVAANGGAIVLNAIPASLTAAGAAAFGTYPAGEAFAPVSAAIPVNADCGAVAEVVPPVEAPGTDQPPAPVWPWILGGGLIILALAAATGILVSRRRREAAAHATGDALQH